MNSVHGLHRQRYKHFLPGVILRQIYAQLQFPATVDHMRIHLVDGVLMRSGPLCDFLTERAAMANEKLGRAGSGIVTRIWREDTEERTIIIRRPFKCVVLTLFVVMLTQSHFDLRQFLDPVE